MTTEQEDLEIRMQEIIKEARAILEYAEEAQHHMQSGNLKAASQILSLSHTKIAGFQRCKQAFLGLLREKGITPNEDFDAVQ